MKYKLAKDIFYRLYNENTVLFKTSSQKINIFNSSAKEILDLFREYSSTEDAIEKLKMHYENISSEVLNGIREFIKQLEKLGIIEKENILLQESNDVEDYIRDKIIHSGQIYSALFELTFRCNERCRHCYCVNDDRPELNTEQIKKVLDELYDLNALEIIFSGGDLFVRKDAFEILEYAYSKHFLISIFTNGIALSDGDILRLKSLNIKSIHFSIYSHIAEKHDFFTQVNGSFDKTTDVIKKCVLVGIPVNIKTLVMNYNFDELAEIMDLARNLGATIQVGMSLNAKNDGDLAPLKFRLDSIEKYCEAIKVVSDNIEFHCGETSNQNRTFNDKICGAGTRAIGINPYGDVFPCNALLLKCGNVLEQPLKEIWEKSSVLNDVRSYTFARLKGCEHCTDIQYCNFCPGAAFTETGNPLKRYNEACNILKAKKLANNL